MAISCIFGTPGCGKSSVLTLLAQKELKKIAKGKSKYKAVYTNFPCRGCLKIQFTRLGDFYYHDALILLDELTLDADSRDFKTFPKSAKEFITLHRHFDIDIVYAVQDYSRAEKTIRNNTVSLRYLSNILGLFVVSRPIYRTITINEYVGDLIMGYRFPTFWELISGDLKIYPIFRARKFFDSYDKFGFDKKPVPKAEIWSAQQQPTTYMPPPPSAKT